MGEEEKERTCPKCGGTRFVRDYSEAQITCASCGYLIEEKMKDMGPEWRAFSEEEKENRSRTGSPITITLHDKGLSTRISRNKRDAKGNLIPSSRREKFGRLKKWNHRSKFGSGRSRTLRDALSSISRVCSQAGFSDPVREMASHLYRRAMKADIVRGRPSEVVVAAAIYIACQKLNVPASLKDIANVTGIDKKKVKKIYRVIIQEFNLDVSPPGLDFYVSPAIEKLVRDLGFLPAIGRKVREIVHEVGKTGLGQNRSGKVIVGAAAYLAVEHSDCHVSAKRIANSLGISSMTVQDAAKFLSDELGDDTLSQILDSSSEGEKRD